MDRVSATRFAALGVIAVAVSACGFNAQTNVKSEAAWAEVNTGGRLPQPTGKAAPPTTRTAPPPIVAVFNVEGRGVQLSAELREGLSTYIAITLAASGRFRVVPRAELTKRLRAEKRESYRKCYDQSCQIEIGRELAAQRTLSTVVFKVGKQCSASAVFYDLRQATSVGGASVESKCDTESLVAATKRLVGKLAKP